MYLPTVATVVAKRRSGNDWSIAFQSHSGKRFEEELSWDFGVDLEPGDLVTFYGNRVGRVASLKDGMDWLSKIKKS